MFNSTTTHGSTSHPAWSMNTQAYWIMGYQFCGLPRWLIRLTNSCNILTRMTYGPMQPMNPFGPSTYATHVKLVLYIVYYTNYSIARVHVLKVASTGERVIHWWAYKSHPKLTLFLPGWHTLKFIINKHVDNKSLSVSHAGQNSPPHYIIYVWNTPFI